MCSDRVVLLMVLAVMLFASLLFFNVSWEGLGLSLMGAVWAIDALIVLHRRK